MRSFITSLPAARRAMFGILLTCMVPATGRRALAEDGPYDKVIRSTAWVLSPEGSGPVAGSTKVSMGTAVVVDARLKLLVTCYHVVQERDKALVYFPKFDADGLPIASSDAYLKDAGARIQGRVVARSSVKDLALIQVDRLPETAVTIPLATRFPHSQEDIFAIGNSGANDDAMWRGSSGASPHRR
jgi:S1-C subfamily serine protease